MPRHLEKPIAPVLARVMQSLRAHTLRDVALAMEVPENTVRTWHKRDRVPSARIEQVAKLTGKPFEWFNAPADELFELPFFLRPQANELAKYVGSDAFGEAAGGPLVAREPGPQPSRPPVRLDAMRTVIEVVVGQLEARGLRLPAAKLADLIVLIYEHLASDEVEEEQVKETASRYLRLVA
jgi:hypothetical protein